MLAQVLQGFLEEFGGNFDLWALLVCIADEDKAALMLDESVESFEKAFKEWKSDKKAAGHDLFAGGILGYAAYN